MFILPQVEVPGLGRTSLQKGRILYGNETDVNEYPWQVQPIYHCTDLYLLC